MKAIWKPVLYLLSAILLPGLIGCKTHPEIQTLSGGYEEITHPNISQDNPEQARVSLNYRAADGRTLLIWPSLFSSDEIIKGDVVIFIGDEAYVSSDQDDPRGTKPRVFVVKAPGPPMDVTDQVLWRWAKESGRDYDKAARLFNLATLVNHGDNVELQLEFYVNESGWPDNATMRLDWNQITEIMRTVEAKGTLHRDPRWGAPFIKN
jgi:hypothetical protein